VSGQRSSLATGGLPVVFVAGAVAVSAMILPGISGSLFLVILGQYTFMSETLHAFIDDLVGLASGNSLATLVENGSVVVAFVLGGLVGLFTVARVVRRALDANRTATLAFLVALVVRALRAPVVALSDRGRRLGRVDGRLVRARRRRRSDTRPPSSTGTPWTSTSKRSDEREGDTTAEWGSEAHPRGSAAARPVSGLLSPHERCNQA